VKITRESCSTYVPADRLDPLREALDAAPAPVDCFFRDDDAGWRDDRLFELLDLFAELGLPLDLAVIPAALGADAARELRARIERSDGRLGAHQHGFAHRNHEPEGERKCEFGPARPRADQLRDIAAGHARLAQLLGPLVEPIFTPPWNRCTEATGQGLAGLGFELVSREARAEPLRVPGLRELPVHVDWLKRRDGERLPRREVAMIAARAVAAGGPVGLMLHHAEMDAAERSDAAELLALMARHARARCLRMRAVCGGRDRRAGPAGTQGLTAGRFG
jgi:hypothetical protein